MAKDEGQNPVNSNFKYEWGEEDSFINEEEGANAIEMDVKNIETETLNPVNDKEEEAAMEIGGIEIFLNIEEIEAKDKNEGGEENNQFFPKMK